MDNVFSVRDQLIAEYSSFARSFTRIAAEDVSLVVERQYDAGHYQPEPLIQINPNYQREGTIQQLVNGGLLHSACADIFQIGKTEAATQTLYLFSTRWKHWQKDVAGKVMWSPRVRARVSP